MPPSIGARRNSVLFIAAVSISSLGNGAFLSIIVVYLTSVVGVSAVLVGALVGGAGLAGAVSSLVFGWLSDRFPPRILFSTLLVLQSSAVLCVGVLSDPCIVAAAVVISGLFESGAAAARATLVARLVGPNSRVRFRATVRSFANGAVAIGAGLGSIALTVDTRFGYFLVILVDVLTFLFAAILILLIVEQVAPFSGGSEQMTIQASSGRPALFDFPFVMVSALIAVLTSAESMMTVAIPLWISVRVRAPLWIVSALLVMNTVGIVACQVSVSSLARDNRSAAKTALMAGGCLAICCAMLFGSFWATDVWLVVLLFIIGAFQTAAELLSAASGWALSYGMAPESRVGEYQGVFSSMLDVGSFIFPLLFGVAVGTNGALAWLLFAVGYLLAGVGVVPLVSDRRSSPDFCDA